jgi:RHS repeat-associated protein
MNCTDTPSTIGFRDSDYYPFGMLIPTRSFAQQMGDAAYRFGFNGKEMDGEVSGLGNSISFEYRHYDVRLGRFKSIDLLSGLYPWQSGYAYAANNPILFIDYLGLGADVPGTPERRTHTLEKGESLYSVSKKYNLKSSDVYSWNPELNKKANSLSVGTVVNVESEESFNLRMNDFINCLKPEIIGRNAWGAREAQTGPKYSYEKIIAPLSSYYNSIVVHHAGNAKDNPSIKDIQDEHMDKNDKADIGYHFAIDQSGNIYQGRPIGIKGAHVDNANTGKIGIVLLGDFDTSNDGLGFFKKLFETSNSPKTTEMISSLQKLVTYLSVKYNIDYLGVHKEVNCERYCPGVEIQGDVKKMSNSLKLKTPSCVAP